MRRRPRLRHRRQASAGGGGAGHPRFEERLAPGGRWTRTARLATGRAFCSPCRRTSSPTRCAGRGTGCAKPRISPSARFSCPASISARRKPARTIVETEVSALQLLYLRLAAGSGGDLGDRREGQRRPPRDRTDHARPAPRHGRRDAGARPLPLPEEDRKAGGGGEPAGVLHLLPLGQVPGLQGDVSGRSISTSSIPT